MAEVIKMPRMSDTMTEGVIVSWLKKVGDNVKSGDVLAEVETDKATMELESYTDGVLLHIGVEEGQAVPVNAVIAVIGKEGEEFQDLLGGGDGESTQSDEKQEKESSSKEEEKTPEKETEDEEKASKEENKEQVKGQEKDKSGEEEKTSSKTASEQKEQAQTQTQSQTQTQTQSDSRVKASPLAKKIAQERGISIEEVGSGSGDNGRIVRKDIESYTPAEKQAQGKEASQGKEQTFAPISAEEGYEEVNVSQMRKTIARRLSESMFSAPHFYLTIDINMGRAMQARTAINDYLGSKVSFNDIIIKAAAAALQKHPKVNGSWMGDKIRYYQHVNVGVAIAVEDGLVVPVVRHADMKPISQITQEVKAYGEKAKGKKLQPTDFEGNTFTISNLGMFGIEQFTAIINTPDACIMAVGAIQEKPIVEKGELKVGNMMKVTLSCDHRIVDGATGAQFLQTFKQYLEEPVTILA